MQQFTYRGFNQQIFGNSSAFGKTATNDAQKWQKTPFRAA
ncbi:hypothetical protein CLOSYM_03087 [[Clostridium] symbiosum ATCC 14940]|uniref:Uncharacterized protein n=1 Tax=[Clostridium] symbiosum ATCC 14940 TaxID=411472 RepID=A0ABC9TVN2_CLOSY|nr:hypothetical protein CLOSYM_03087 [[Clostridium] symbiosum ATCC 14940]